MMLVLTTAKQHQLRDLYSMLILFSECGIINLVEKQNCTVHNGTWYNHTCYVVTDGDHDKYSVNLTSEYMMRSVLASRKSPSDEYFQYVLCITRLLLFALFPSSGGRRNGFEYHSSNLSCPEHPPPLLHFTYLFLLHFHHN